MSEYKPRGIRMYDELWEQVQGEAALHGRSASAFIASVLMRHFDRSPRRCFYCGAPADAELEWVQPDARDAGPDELLTHLAETGDVLPERFTPPRLVLCVCGEHEESAAYVLDTSVGFPLGNPERPHKTADADPETVRAMREMLPILSRRG